MSTFNTGQIQEILKRLQRQQDEANAANIQRRDDILGIRTGAGTFAGGLLGRAGQTAKRDIARTATRSLARSEQDLISRGLGNTTIRSAARRGIREDQARSTERISEQVSLARAGFLERVTDTGPDQGLIASLARGAASNPGRISATVGARSGGGAGGGGSSGSGGFGGGSSGSGSGAQGVQTFTNQGNVTGLFQGAATQAAGDEMVNVFLAGKKFTIPRRNLGNFLRANLGARVAG